MGNKIRQITDSIHGTIYISELEHLMMSTPFFYRLHDVYQSSTVYMTFPSNRTKRYEHSLGTMELAGQMFYACVTNASAKDRKCFLKEINDLFEEILKRIENRRELKRVEIYRKYADSLENLIPPSACKKDAFLDMLQKTKDEAPLSDLALCKQEVCFFDLLESNNAKSMNMIALYSFLYQCVLEALRVAALFHDAGHPPFSHIIEFTLERLYNEKNERYIEEKHADFKSYLENYVGCCAIEDLLLDLCGHRGQYKDPALHEQIGTHILYNAYSGVIGKRVAEWNTPNRYEESNCLRAIYLIVVLEFTFGILMEKTPVLASLHRIIDGPVDVDRLDYIVRDSMNSGVNWGQVPYTRIISAAKFAYNDEGTLKIAFPEKVCDDLDDMLVNRYKIFQRINYHHKSIKTSELMQRSVEMLAEDYLMSPKGQEIAPDIHKLWSSVEANFGKNATENQISQWTDSWLISVLSQALATLSDIGERHKLVKPDIGRTDDKLDKLYRMLEEVQLNRKRYFPLLKRQRDALYLRDKIIARAGIQQEALSKVSIHEYKNLREKAGEDADSARESLYRIELLQDKILRVADFSNLDIILHCDETCQELIEGVLEAALKDGEIQDYFLWPNRGFSSLGISDETEISLYRNGHDVYKYDMSTSLFPRLRAQKAGCLWMYSYVCLPECSESEVDGQIENLLDRIANAIGESIKNAMNRLFHFDKRISEP